jgi:hypothetical protein
MFPRWLSWLFLFALGYILYSASQISAPKDPAPGAIPAITQTDYPALAEITDVERWKRKLNPEYAATMNCTIDTPKAHKGLEFTVTQITAGEGVGAACGDTITIALTIWNASGKAGYKAQLPLALGSRQLASGLDFGLLGITVGGERRFVLPPYALMRGTAPKQLDAARKALPADKVATISVKRVK